MAQGASHPCYDAEAHRRYARIHLPVAPACNVQCRFCNRRFDCPNETRPGVASRILGPEEAADRVDRVREDLPNLSVVGIAGPGEPLANRSTMETFRLVRERHPDLLLCLATNGLLLPQSVEALRALGVRHVTVTINAIDDDVGGQIYSWALIDGERRQGREGFKALAGQQWSGLRQCVEGGIVVKVNSVLIPGINEDELPEIARRAGEAGASVMNVIPFLPVRGSEFEAREAPSVLETRRVRAECERHIRQIRHCARCRADAVGLLGCDLSSRYC